MHILSLLCVILLVVIGVSGLWQDGCPSLATPASKTHLHKMSICTMINNEANNIQEWIEYHHVVLKVDHFYIYNDGSTDNIVKILRPYVDQGIVSLFTWNNNRTVDADLVYKDPAFTLNQRFCIADCVYHHQHETEWIGIWDVDEFLYLNEKYTDYRDFIERYLDYHRLDILQIPMTIFGPSHHEARPKGLVMENYHFRKNSTMFGYDPDSNKFVGKSMYRSGCATPEVHFSPVLPANCDTRRNWPNLKAHPDFPVHFKHYWTKSWEDFKDKMGKWGWSTNYPKFLNYTAEFYDIYDTSMDKYVATVKHAIACNSN